ncbi:MAG: MFS transporter [Rhizobiales bacterium]|nr:MFS transporter [Hyphomicrobiales bacterium]
MPALPGIAAALRTDFASVQLILSFYLICMAAAQLALGPLSDRFGRRPVLIGGFILAVVTSFGAMLATTISSLVVARGLQAFGASAGIVIGRVIIRDLSQRDQALHRHLRDLRARGHRVRAAGDDQDARRRRRHPPFHPGIAAVADQQAVCRLYALLRHRLGAVLRISRRRAARRHHVDGPLIGRARHLVRDRCRRLHGRQLYVGALVAAPRRRPHGDVGRRDRRGRRRQHSHPRRLLSRRRPDHDLPAAVHHRVRQRNAATEQHRRRDQRAPAGGRHRGRHHRLAADGGRRRRRASRHPLPRTGAHGDADGDHHRRLRRRLYGLLFRPAAQPLDHGDFGSDRSIAANVIDS